MLKELEGKADLIIGAYHYGLEGEYGVEGMEQVVTAYADQLDGVFIGHAHANVDETIAGVPVLEPANNGKYVGKMTFNMVKKDGAWTVASHTADLLDSSAVEPDKAFMDQMKDLHEKSLAMASKPVGEVAETFMDPVYPAARHPPGHHRGQPHHRPCEPGTDEGERCGCVPGRPVYRGRQPGEGPLPPPGQREDLQVRQHPLRREGDGQAAQGHHGAAGR